MKRMWRRTPGVLGWLVLVLVVAGSAPVDAQSMDGVSTIYLVRHAERAADDPRDPTLTDEGTARAIELARVLSDVPFTNLFSTNLRRTRLTAAPIAEASGLEVQFYPWGDQEGMAAFLETLRTTPGHHLVSGHSNTTPALVEMLGGDPISAIDEFEYDRLYIVTIGPDGSVTSTLLRYGAPSGH